MAQKILVQLSNDRQPTLPGMAEIVYSKEPAHCKKKYTTQKRKKKPPSLFSLTNPQEKARVQHGIKGVCGAVYEQLDFHTIIHDTNKDQQWNEILKYCVAFPSGSSQFQKESQKEQSRQAKTDKPPDEEGKKQSDSCKKPYHQLWNKKVCHSGKNKSQTQ